MSFKKIVFFDLLNLAVLILAFTMIFIYFPPITESLLNCGPSVLGWVEIIIFLTHVILGLFCFICYNLLERKIKINVVLLISIIYLLSLNYVIWLHGKTGMFLGLIIVETLEIYFIHKIYKNNYLIGRAKLVISLVIFFLLYQVLIKF